MPRNANFYLSRQRVARMLARRQPKPVEPAPVKAPKSVKPSKSK